MLMSMNTSRVSLSLSEVFDYALQWTFLIGDDSGRWSLLWQKDSNKIGFPGHHPRAFSPPVQNTKFRVQTIRIIFCHSKIQGHSEIDAVALLGMSLLKILDTNAPVALQTGIPRKNEIKVKFQNYSAENLGNVLTQAKIWKVDLTSYN